MKYLLIISTLFFNLASKAELVQFVVGSKPVSQMIQFSIPYTMGTHKGVAKELHANVKLDESKHTVHAQFRIPISSMTTRNATRDCHMREALGINYTDSKFPKEHVCNSNDQIPETGPDSIEFPDITVEFIEMTLPIESITLGMPENSDVTVKIKIHGIERVQTWPVIITKTVDESGSEGFNLISQFEQKLSDFNIQVKPLNFLGMNIGVENTVSIQVNLELHKKLL